MIEIKKLGFGLINFGKERLNVIVLLFSNLGHPEPENLKNFFKEISTENTSDEYASLSIRDEIFNSVKYELRDELNVPLDALTDPLLLGIVCSLERLGRVGQFNSLVFT